MIFQYIPFADHNAMLDPPTVDITGRILEMLAQYGYTRRDKRVEKAMQFILKEQEPDGSWFGRWGVNYLYGTFLVLRGLEAMGMWNHEPAIQQAAEWIRMVQNADGGWGETCGSYDDPNSARHWAKHAIADRMGRSWPAGGRRYRSDSVAKGVRWLIERQHEDGSWDELVPGRNGEELLHRHRVPARVLSWISLVQAVFPAAGADDLQARNGERSAQQRRV